MKADLDDKGTLVVRAESPIESFALSHWYALWQKDEVLLLVTTVERSDDGYLDPGLTEVKPRGI